MARPRLIDDEELLVSLRESFLKLGPAASTQELAARAGVSEGTLFKRFESKHRMFALAMRLPPLEGPWIDEMLDRAGTGSLGDHLRDVASGLVSHLEELFPRLMCALGRPLAPEDLRLIMGDDEAPPILMLRRITRMFEIEIAAGRVRPLPARHLAELFLGAVQHHVHRVAIFGERAAVEPDLQTFARELAATVESLVSIVPPPQPSH